jgi:hypothetical protein
MGAETKKARRENPDHLSGRRGVQLETNLNCGETKSVSAVRPWLEGNGWMLLRPPGCRSPESQQFRASVSTNECQGFVLGEASFINATNGRRDPVANTWMELRNL